MNTWEQRMSERAKAREAKRREEETRRQEAASAAGSAADRAVYAGREIKLAAEPGPIHLHGTLTCCACGAETGMTCVVFTEEYINNPPTECNLCGKPVDQWGDGKPYDLDAAHEYGCPVHPGSVRCCECGRTLGYGAVTFGRSGEVRHFACEPGAERWDPETESWIPIAQRKREAT